MSLVYDHTLDEPQCVAQFGYRLVKADGGSSKYGPCEVCDKAPDTTYHQIERRAYLSGGKLKWTNHGCHDLFGHRECLEQMQNRPVMADSDFRKTAWLLSMKRRSDKEVNNAGN